MLDDCNTDVWETSFSVANRAPVGRFSYGFFIRLRDAALGQLQAGRTRPGPRRKSTSALFSINPRNAIMSSVIFGPWFRGCVCKPDPTEDR